MINLKEAIDEINKVPLEEIPIKYYKIKELAIEIVKKILKENNLMPFANMDESVFSNETVMLSILEHNPEENVWLLVSKSLRDNKNFIMKTVDKRFDSIKFASKRLRADEDVVLSCIEKKSNNYIYVDKKQSINEKVLDIVINNQRNEDVLKKIAQEVGDDYCKIEELLDKNGYLLNFLKHEFKDDENLVKRAVKNNSIAFGFASDRLHSDFEFITSLLKENAFSNASQILYCFGNKEYKKEKEITNLLVLMDNCGLFEKVSSNYVIIQVVLNLRKNCPKYRYLLENDTNMNKNPLEQLKYMIRLVNSQMMEEKMEFKSKEQKVLKY